MAMEGRLPQLRQQGLLNCEDILWQLRLTFRCVCESADAKCCRPHTWLLLCLGLSEALWQVKLMAMEGGLPQLRQQGLLNGEDNLWQLRLTFRCVCESADAKCRRPHTWLLLCLG